MRKKSFYFVFLKLIDTQVDTEWTIIEFYVLYTIKTDWYDDPFESFVHAYVCLYGVYADWLIGWRSSLLSGTELVNYRSDLAEINVKTNANSSAFGISNERILPLAQMNIATLGYIAHVYQFDTHAFAVVAVVVGGLSCISCCFFSYCTLHVAHCCLIFPFWYQHINRECVLSVQ